MIHYSWPHTICPPLSGLTWGQLYAADVTEPLDGVEHVRAYWTGPKRSSKVEFILDGADPSRDHVRALLDAIRPQATIVSLRHPVARYLRRQWVGYGDGTRKEFILPAHAYADAARLIIQGVGGQDTPTLYEQANLLTDDQAAQIASVTGLSANKEGGAGTVTLTRSAVESLYGTHAARIATTVNTTTNPGVVTDYVSGLNVGHYYTGMAYVLTASANARARIVWHDAGAGTMGTSTGTTTAAGDGWTLVQVTDVAPAGTARAKLYIECVAQAAPVGRVMLASCIGFAPLRSAEWWLPSLSPGVAVATSAPADDASVYLSTLAAAYPVLSYRVTGGNELATDSAGNDSWSWDLVETWES